MRRRSFPEAALPAHTYFLRLFLIESPMQAPVNKHGWDIFFFQYSHHAVQELLFISVKFYNVIKVLVRTGYGCISL
jgi:hypothetical protein